MQCFTYRTTKCFRYSISLYEQINNIQAYRKILSSAASGAVAAAFNLPTQSLKMALTVVATGPIVFAYPFVQKYFVQGITIGAVKDDETGERNVAHGFLQKTG